MYLSKVIAKNYRLLKDFSIDLESELSLIIGKNNVGKTSLLYLMETMLRPSEKLEIHIDDFNVDFKNELVKQLTAKEELGIDEYKEDGIKLRLIVKYSDADDLSNVGLIMLDLDENNYYVVLGYDYLLTFEAYRRLRAKAQELLEMHHDSDLKTEVEYILEKQLSNYFTLQKKSILYDIENECPAESDYIFLKDRPQFHVESLISIGVIDAKRQVANKDTDKTLSIQTTQLFDKLNKDSHIQDDFVQVMAQADKKLGDVYADMFKEVIGKVESMGGMKPKDTKLKITSSLQQRNLLNGNTKVVYDQEGVQLPENHNGLGYMNLISMIFQIEIIRKQFEQGRNGRMADINLLVIEEPEAHTHPQMQYIFMKNIMSLLGTELNANEEIRQIQSIISTHSSHIVSESDFDVIKYLVRYGNEVKAKNLKDLQKQYDNDEQKWYTFLKHYLTLNRSELFFADKAIFIEGDTERILLPALMKKVDQEYPCHDGETPLCQQNISIIEVGAYSHKFGKFINFVRLKKAVIFTDLDYGHFENGRVSACRYDKDDDMYTSNASLKSYFKELRDGNQLKVKKLISLRPEQKRLLWDEESNGWKTDETGNVAVFFQEEVNGYHPRTFEDNFFEMNKEYFREHKDSFWGLKRSSLQKFLHDGGIDSYELAETGIESKGTLAVEILYNSTQEDGKDFCGWKIPKYLEEGLLWIRK